MKGDSKDNGQNIPQKLVRKILRNMIKPSNFTREYFS